MSNITSDFISATKKIHADVRSLLTTLHLIRADVKTIRDRTVGDNQKSPEQLAKKPDEKQADFNQAGLPKQETKPYFHDLIGRLKKSSRKPRFVIEVLTLLGLIFYACETRRTNNLTETALETSKTQFAESQATSKEQFEADQRPFVWISKLEPEKLKAGEKITWSYWLTNYGKTPAVDVHIVGKVQFGKDDNMSPEWGPFAPNDPGYIIPQGIPPAPAKGTLYSSAFSDIAVDDPKGLDVDGGYFLFIHAEYCGLDRKTKYTSNLCYFHLKTGAIAGCKGYNEIR